MDHTAKFEDHGWGFPPAFSPGGRELTMVSGSEDIQQSIEILFGTRLFERAMQESFGCSLDELQFEALDQQVLIRMEEAIMEALLEFEPRIEVEALDILADQMHEGQLLIQIQYKVKYTDTYYNLVYPYFFMEGN
ncbi:MAG: GPW/gp25 family protein [Phaeodactylibacter sp.]|nr:GPW/gp25 family protein [Phaeodactylibacter sp.]